MRLADKMLQALKDMDKPSPPLTRAPRPQWMSAGSLRLINERADNFRWPDHNYNVARNMTRAV